MKDRYFLRYTALLGLALALVALFGMITAPSALAHAVVVAASPAPGDRITGQKLDIFLEFNTRLDLTRSRLVLILPDGGSLDISLAQGLAPNVLAGKISDLASGAYSLRWLVMATDGHITRGEIPFSVIP